VQGICGGLPFAAHHRKISLSRRSLRALKWWVAKRNPPYALWLLTCREDVREERERC
jgi:hypothetical protein